MFVIDQSGTFEWPVRYKAPAEKGGKQKEHEFTATFKRLNQDDLEQRWKAVASRELEPDALLDEVLQGWAGIKTSTGETFEFNEAHRRILYDLAGMRQALLAAYADASAGRAAAKN